MFKAGVVTMPPRATAATAFSNTRPPNRKAQTRPYRGTHLAAHTRAPPTAPLPQPNRPALSRRLVFRHRLISLDEQRSGAAHRLDNGETLR